MSYIMIFFKLHLKFVPVFFVVVHTVKASAVDVGENPFIFELKMWPSNYREGCRNEQQGQSLQTATACLALLL